MEPHFPGPSESEGLRTSETIGVVDEKATEQGRRLSSGYNSYRVADLLTVTSPLPSQAPPFLKLSSEEALNFGGSAFSDYLSLLNNRVKIFTPTSRGSLQVLIKTMRESPLVHRGHAIIHKAFIIISILPALHTGSGTKGLSSL